MPGRKYAYRKAGQWGFVKEHKARIVFFIAFVFNFKRNL